MHRELSPVLFSRLMAAHCSVAVSQFEWDPDAISLPISHSSSPVAAGVSVTRAASCPADSKHAAERSMGARDTPPTRKTGRRATPAAKREATSWPALAGRGVEA